MNKALKINSNSEDEIELFCVDKNLFVKKIHKGRGADRFLNAILKQKNFQRSYGLFKNIHNTRILEFKADNNSVEIVMPYIDGISGADFPHHGDSLVASTLSRCLNDFLSFEMMKSSHVDISKTIFLNKLSEISKSNGAIEFAGQLCILFEWIKGMSELIMFPMGICHGDLTLNNILYLNESIYLIDFLQTFLETPLQDAVKLDQDFKYGWSLRNSTKEIQTKGHIFYRHSYPPILTDIKNNYKNQYQILMALCIARIIPYIKDDITSKWVLVNLNKIIEDI